MSEDISNLWTKEALDLFFEEATIRKAREILHRRAMEGQKVDPLDESTEPNVSGSR